MFIHLDPRRAEVLVPKGFMGQPQLVLQVGLNMAIPIPDLKIDEGGISCTLSFNRAPFWCRIPWSAIYALVGEDGRGGVWAEDVPPEIQQQKQSAPPKATTSKRARPKLTAVDTSERGRARDDGEKGAKPAEGASPPRGLTSVRGPASDLPAHPARADATSSAADSGDDGIVETEPTRARISAVPREEPEPVEPGAEREQATRPSQRPAAEGKKSKREIPPYLRVIK